MNDNNKSTFEGMDLIKKNKTICASVTRASMVIEKLDTGFLSELIRYEDFVNGSGKFYYTARPPTGLTSVHIPYDLNSFYMSLKYYGRASAPAFLYQQLDIESGSIYRTKKT